MTPSEIHDLLARYADGEISAAERARVEAEIASSPEAAATVERWRALRRCANRSIRATPLPADLELRIRDRLAHARAFSSSRVYRFASIFAAAAAVILVIAFWQQRGGSGAQANATGITIEPARFARIYNACAKQHHEGVKLSKNCPIAAQALMDQLHRDYRVLIPDLREAGFELYGICECFPRGGQTRGMHAYYRSRDAEPRYVSIFSVSCGIGLTGCGKDVCCKSNRTYQHGFSDGVNVVQWSEKGGCFVLAGEMDFAELQTLASNVKIAARGS